MNWFGRKALAQEQEQTQLQAPIQQQKPLVELAAFDPLDDAIELEEEVRALEQGVRDVNDLFHDMLTIVHEQSQVIDRIDQNVEQSLHSTTQAVRELKQADESYSPACIIA